MRRAVLCLFVLSVVAFSSVLASPTAAFAGGADPATADRAAFAITESCGYDPAIYGYDDRGNSARPRTRVFIPVLAAKAGGGDTASTAARIHGNSASSPATSYLYRLEDAATGEYLKTGISQNPFSRYSQTFMRGKRMRILQDGSRREMLNLERFIVERDPGLLNREPWAGRYANDVPGGG
jgi:hypothetical protein